MNDKSRAPQHRERLQKGRAGLCSTWRSPRCATPRATPLQHTLPLARARRPRRSAMDTRALASSSVGPRPNAAAPAQLACWPACRRRPPRALGAPSRIAPAARDHSAITHAQWHQQLSFARPNLLLTCSRRPRLWLDRRPLPTPERTASCRFALASRSFASRREKRASSTSSTRQQCSRTRTSILWADGSVLVHPVGHVEGPHARA